MSVGIGSKVVICLLAVLSSLGSIPIFVPAGHGADDGWGYHTSAEISEMVKELADSYPDKATATTAQSLFGVRTIEGGRTIPILFIGDPDKGGKPTVLIVGAHHGNEPDSAEGALGFAYYLLKTSNEVNSEVLENVNVIVLPVLNPYGLDKGTRVDDQGQDINRDYPFSPSPASSDSDGVPLTTPGALTVHDLAKRYPIEIALSFHTGSWGIFTVWGASGTGNVTPDHRSLMDLGATMSKASAQGMPYGPANDYKGISYLFGAYDDHLYGSSIMPQKVYSQDMVLPFSTSVYTIELGTQTGKEPSGLGSPADMDGRTGLSVPTAIRICLAACLVASNSVNVEMKGAEAKFTVFGTETAKGLSVSQTRSDGTIGPAQYIASSDRTYPIVRLSVEPKAGTASLCIEGSTHPSWMDLYEGSSPAIGPRSLLASSSQRTLFELVPIPVDQDTTFLMIASVPTDIRVGSTFRTSIDIVSEGTMENLSLEVEGYRTFYYTRVVEGRSVVELTAPPDAGDYSLRARLRTSGGTYTDVQRFTVYPGVSWTFIDDGPTLSVLVTLSGTDSSEGALIMVRPFEDDGRDSRAFGETLFPGDNRFDLDLSDVHGKMLLSVSTRPWGDNEERVVRVPPSFHLSKVPIRTEGDRLLLGPVTAYLGTEPVGPYGDYGNNTVEVVLVSEKDTSTLVMEYVDLSYLSDTEKEMAFEQASMEGADPSRLTGAFFIRVELPDAGDYTVFGTLKNDAGEFRSPPGNGTERYRYGSFEVEDGHRPFPYLLVVLFVSLAVVMAVVSYLRFPAKMESLAKRELARKEQERMDMLRRRSRR